MISSVDDEFNKEFMRYADILFLSDEQLPCKPETFIHDLKNRYTCKIIVIGPDGKGVMLYEKAGDKIYYLEAANIGEVINTVGAGDALFSAFLNFYGKGFKPLEALQLAEIFAAYKVGYNGVSEGFCEEKVVMELYDKVKRINICQVHADNKENYYV